MDGGYRDLYESERAASPRMKRSEERFAEKEKSSRINS